MSNIKSNKLKNNEKIFDLEFENHIVEVHYKKIKYARIRINKDGTILLSAPFFYSIKNIFEMLQKYKIWLDVTVQKQQNLKLQNNQVQILGKIYTLTLDPLVTNLKIRDDEILTCSMDKFEDYKLKLAKSEFQEIIDKFLPLIKRDVKRIVVRKMSTRWGSCNYKKGYINLNLHLIEKNHKFVEYVILHELAHLVFPHHQNSFYEFIEKIMPDYKERQKDKI